MGYCWQFWSQEWSSYHRDHFRIQRLCKFSHRLQDSSLPFQYLLLLQGRDQQWGSSNTCWASRGREWVWWRHLRVLHGCDHWINQLISTQSHIATLMLLMHSLHINFNPFMFVMMNHTKNVLSEHVSNDSAWANLSEEVGLHEWA